MQKYFTIICLLIAAGNLAAQEAEPAPFKLRLEVGLQANSLFDRLANDAGGNTAANPYLLTGKIGLGESLAIRVGMGGQHDKEIQRVDGFANSTTILKQRLDLRLGMERVFPLGDRWFGFLGGDVVANWTQDKTIEDSGFDVITESNDVQYIGGGLSAGIKFKVTKRLSFGTEGFLYYVVGEKTDGEFFKNFPVGEDKINKSDISSVKVGLPSALYLILEF